MDATDHLMTDSEVQEFLGVSRTTLWRLRKRAGFPYARVGRCCRYQRSAILEWLKSGAAAAEQLTLTLR